MANTVTPTFTDNVSVVAAALLARGSTTRGTLDLRTKFGAYLFCKIGRGGTTGITNGVDVQIRRVLNNDGASAGAIHPVGIPLLSSIAAAASTTVDANSNAGQKVLNVASTTSFAAGDIICIEDGDGTGVTRLEWCRVSKITNAGASGELNVDANLRFDHSLANADYVRNKADVFVPVWLAGGSLWEVIFDYGDDAAGDSVYIQALAQTYDSDSIA